MPYPHPPAACPAPITDRLLATLIATWEREPDAALTDAEAQLIIQTTPGCLRELATYRRLLGRCYAEAWIEGAIEAGPNVVRLPANRPLAGGGAA